MLTKKIFLLTCKGQDHTFVTNVEQTTEINFENSTVRLDSFQKYPIANWIWNFLKTVCCTLHFPTSILLCYLNQGVNSLCGWC